MRAKFRVSSVEVYSHEGKTTGEKIKFVAVSRSDTYPPDGNDENNTYAKFSPAADCSIHIANPALFGKYMTGQQFYVDFTPVPTA